MSLLPEFTSRSELESRSTQAAKSAYLGNRSSLCRVLSCYNFFVPTYDHSLSPHLLLQGYWEAWVTLAVVNACKGRKGQTAINVGANLGYYSTILADCVGPEGTMIGFEPQPAIAEFASWNLRSNGLLGQGRISVKAVNDGSDKQVFLTVFEELKGSAYVSDKPQAGQLPIPATCVDNEVQQCDILFVDAEGSEEKVLAGARKALQRSPDPVVFIEFSPASYADPQGFFKHLSDEYIVRMVDYDGTEKRVEFADLDTANWTMLVLRRN